MDSTRYSAIKTKKQLNRYELVAFNFQLYYIVLIENITYTKLY